MRMTTPWRGGVFHRMHGVRTRSVIWITMSRKIKIALDAMGLDHGPAETVRAAARVSRETTISVVLVGPEDTLKAELARHEHNPEQIEIRHASQVIHMAEKPRTALSRKKDASIAVAAQLVGAGEADALVSAGSTGALVMASALYIPRIPGVKRAALAAVYPTRERNFSNDRFSLILDVGATVRVRAQDLLFFAYMGHAYASRISKTPHPSIGLLNLGAEETKGDEVLREAHQLMKVDRKLNFIGNVEGNDIPSGIADVIVCEGFTGNVVLKMAEGLSEIFTNLGAWAFKQSLFWRIGLMFLAGGLKQLKTVTDYREYGGAPFLGFSRLVIKAHGRSRAGAIANAIKVAAKGVRDGVCEEIEAAVTEFNERTGGPQPEPEPPEQVAD